MSSNQNPYASPRAVAIAAEAAAERVGQLAGIGPGDFIDSIRPL